MRSLVLRPPDRIITGPVAVVVDWYTRLIRKPPFLGDGSDGPAVLDGYRDVGWARRTGNVYEMTRDCQVSFLWVRPGCTLMTNGYRILSRGPVRGSLRLRNGHANR